MKKALVYNAYLNILGGGERYTLTFALGLLKNGYEVELAWNDTSILQKASNRFGLDFSKIKVNSEAYKECSNGNSVLRRFLFTKKYDLIFWVFSGNIPYLFSSINLLHFQVPLSKIGGSIFSNFLKCIFINKFVYNSEFTRRFHELHFSRKKGFVLYPPVDIQKFHSGEKENLIISVGRFGSKPASKRQDVLLESFKILCSKVKGYKLIMVGGLAKDPSTVEKLKEKSAGYPVKIITGAEFGKIIELYSKAKFFWHATGYGIDESLEPEKVEHFGMSTVEAMASECIPIVIGKGGQKEILTKDTGLMCESKMEMASETIELIHNKGKMDEIRSNLVERSKKFSIFEFYKKITILTTNA